MASTTMAVIIASAQSVAKVFVIGTVGYLSVIYPKEAPFLASAYVGKLARFTFHTLTIPLIYSSIAVAVSIEYMADYWFVIVGAFFVLGTSYAVATILRSCCISISNERDFQALRVAATFPNIVSLPILIFPSLCEFPVVHEGYMKRSGESIEDAAESLERQCVAQSTTMIFMYFFSWSLAFWSFGNARLMDAGTKSTSSEGMPSVTNENETSNLDLSFVYEDQNDARKDNSALNLTGNIPPEDSSGDRFEECKLKDDEEIKKERNGGLGGTTPEANTLNSSFCRAIQKTMTSPGFLAMIAGVVTALIPPLKSAMFDGGGALRFFGSAVETLGTATTSISTMVVAASLVPPHRQGRDETGFKNGDIIHEDNPAMSDPNFGPFTRRKIDDNERRRSSRLQDFRTSIQRGSVRILQAMPRSSPEMKRMHVWFCLAKLILSPAIVVGMILALDCSGSEGLLEDVPNLAKLVIIINSALPGALIVIVLLKSKEEMADTAAAVAKVYMPSYLLSILTIAAWTAVGLWITLPDDDGLTICQRD